MIWIAGNRKKGISVYKVRGSSIYRKGMGTKWAWAVAVWRNNKLARTPEYYPTRKEAISEAKSRAKAGWLD